MQTDTIAVPEIHCEHCKQSIEGALTPLPGVARAVVDVPTATVDVAYDPAAVSRADLEAVIREQGYEVPAQS